MTENGNPARPTHPKLPNLTRGIAGALLFGVLGTLLVVYLTRGRTDLGSLLIVRPPYILAAVGLVILGWVLDAVRLVIMVRPLGGQLGLGRALRTTLMANFVSGVTPFDTGGEPLAIYLLTEAGIRLGESTAVIAVKSLLSAAIRLLLAIILPLVLFALKRSWALPAGVNFFLSAGLLVYLVGLTGMALLAAYPQLIGGLTGFLLHGRLACRLLSEEKRAHLMERVGRAVSDFRDALALLYRENRATVIWAAVLTFLVWCLTFAVPLVVLIGVGLNPPWAEVIAVAAVFYLIAAYAPTPGSSGAAETSSALLFTKLVPLKFLGLFVLVWRLVAFYLGLAVGGVMLILHLRNSPKRTRTR